MCKPAGGVCNHDVDVARAGSDERIVNDGRGIRAGRLRDDRNAGAPAPLLQLLDGRGAEGVCRGEQHRMAARLQSVRELADGGRLAGAVHPHGEDHEWPVRAEIASGASTVCMQAARSLPQQLRCRDTRGADAPLRISSRSHAVASTPTSADQERSRALRRALVERPLPSPSRSAVSHAVPRLRRALSFAKKPRLLSSSDSAAISPKSSDETFC